MILVNNIVLTDKIRQSFIEAGEKEIWDGLLKLIADRYHFTKDELDGIIDESTSIDVPTDILKKIAE